MESNTVNIDRTLLQQLLNRLEDLTNQINQLQAALTASQAENAKLKEMLGKNSRNSSKQPSSDGYSKPAPKSQRQITDLLVPSSHRNFLLSCNKLSFGFSFL